MSIEVLKYAVGSIHYYHNIQLCVIVCQSSLHNVFCVFTMFSVKLLYKDLWDPRQGDTFNLHIEKLNQHDRYAVAIKIEGDTIQQDM